MIFDEHFLKRMDVAKAIAHPADDLRKVSGQVLNMTARNAFLHPESRPTSGKKTENWYRPGDCITAAVVLRLWNAGFSDSATFEAAVDRLTSWRVTDEKPNWKDGDPLPEGPPPANRPSSPAAFILKDFCEDGRGWTLGIDHRRHNVTGEFRSVAALWRADGNLMGNGYTDPEGEATLSVHVIVLDEILAQVAASTIFRKRAH